jgi:hypothetical protein
LPIGQRDEFCNVAEEFNETDKIFRVFYLFVRAQKLIFLCLDRKITISSTIWRRRNAFDKASAASARRSPSIQKISARFSLDQAFRLIHTIHARATLMPSLDGVGSLFHTLSKNTAFTWRFLPRCSLGRD